MGGLFPLFLPSFRANSVFIRHFILRVFHGHFRISHFATITRLLDGQKCIRKNHGKALLLQKCSKITLIFCRLDCVGGITSTNPETQNGTLNPETERQPWTPWLPISVERPMQGYFGSALLSLQPCGSFSF